MRTSGYERGVFKLRYTLLLTAIPISPFGFTGLGYIVSVEYTLLKYRKGYCIAVLSAALVAMREECLHTGVVYVGGEG